MTNNFQNKTHEYYLFNSRIITHVVFWIFYYVLFSLLWTIEENYYRSFALEFVLMPMRVAASYIVMYYLIPKYLERNELMKFGLFYLLIISSAGLFQRLSIFYFYELYFYDDQRSLIDISSVIRSIVLINTTVLFLSAVKIFKLWQIEKTNKQQEKQTLILIRSEKRNHRVLPSDILYIEALGNYVIYYLKNRNKLISYISLKEAQKILPSNFDRIHKSFIINKNMVTSFTQDNVEIQERIIPIGKSNELTFD